VSGSRTFRWEEIEQSEPLPGITRQTIHGDHQTVVRYVYAPGSVFPIHHHPQEQITLVLSGSIAFTVGGERVVLGPGEVAVIPGGIPHGATVEGRERVVTLNTMSPRRLDDPLDGQQST
jgi:quercetin dioxygenase-like cupin family protein